MRPLLHLIRVYKRHAVEKVRAGIDLRCDEVEKRDGEEESCGVSWVNA
jgi:hypothetical protein